MLSFIMFPLSLFECLIDKRSLAATILLVTKKNNTWDSNVVPHRSTNQAR